MTTPVLGFGLQPFGVTGGGLGSPADYPAYGYTWDRYADVVDVRAIDPLLRDYSVSEATGLPHGAMTRMQQTVLLKLTTPRGQLPWDLSFGDDTNNLRKMPANLLQTVRGFADEALKDEINEGALRILTVTAERVGGTLYRSVTWADTTTKTQTVNTTKF